MKTGQFTKLLVFTLVIQMTLAPIASAVSAGDVITQGLQQILGAQQAILAQQQAAIMSAQRQAQIDPTICPNSPSSNNRCVSEIFPQCNILKTIPNIVEASVCRPPGLNPGNPNDQARLTEALSVYNDYLQLETMYRDFAAVSTQRSNEGMTCLNRAATDLELGLKNREKQIDDLIRQISDAQKEFTQNILLPDLTAIEDSQALLEGNAFKGRKTALEQNSVKFGDTFDDASCSAVLNGAQFNEVGQARGLNGIEARLLDINSKKQNDSAGSFNATEFTGLAAKNLQDQIVAMSNSIANDVKSNPEGLTTSASGINDIYGLVANARLVPAILAEQNKELQTFQRDLNTEVAAYNQAGSTQDIMANLYGSSDEAFDQALDQYERDKNSACFERSTNIRNLLSGSIAMMREGASQSGQVNAFRSEISTILNNPNLSLDEKLKQVNALERQGSNSRYYLTLSAPLPIPQPDGSVVTIKPSQRLSPADFIEYHVSNCRSQFNARNGKKVSDSQMLEKFRATRNKYSNYRKTLPNKVKNAITNRLVNCTDNVQANATGSATCSAADLSTSSPTFCVKRANACASKMRSCYAKAKDKVKDVTKKRDNHIGRYRANITRNKAQLQGMYAKLTVILAEQSFLQENSPLRQSLVLPNTVDLNLNFDERLDRNSYVKGLDGLEIENPDTYFQRTKQNLESVKAALVEQRNSIMNGSPDSSVDSEIAKGVNGHRQSIQTYLDVGKREAERAKSQCDETIQRYIAGYQRIQDEQARAANEAQQAQGEFCNNLNSFSSFPTCPADDFYDASVEIAQRAGGGTSDALGQARAFNNYCRQFSNEADASTAAPTVTVAQALARANRESTVIPGNPTRDSEFAAAACATDTYSSTSACRTYLFQFSGLCSGLDNVTSIKNSADLKSMLPSFISSYGDGDIRNGVCDNQPTTGLSDACASAILNLRTQNRNGSCSGGVSDSQSAVVRTIGTPTSRAIAAGGLPDQAELDARWSQLGENRNNPCAGQNNGSGGTLVDAFNQGFMGGQQPANPAAGAQGVQY